MPIRRQRRYHWPSTSRCETGVSKAASTCCCSASAAASPGDRSCCDGETMKLALVFPGQGSQSPGMMSRYESYPVVRDTFAEASAALGQDLWALVEDGDGEALNQTVNTQPLMLAADIAVYRAWRAAGGRAANVLAGHSLGEYAALVAAGSLAFSDALPLVRFRAQSMQEAVPTGVGAMAAIVGLDAAGVEDACREAAQGQVVDP